MFLLDTMVLSERGKRRPHEAVSAWLDGTAKGKAYVSVRTFGEIAAGIAKKRVSDPVFATRLQAWASDAQADLGDRTLPVTMAIALRWGELATRLNRRDPDLLIAATALEHDLTVATRNVRHFEPTGAKLFNPYEA
ncbi:type II toxin-antitoxin system VapC family toxin [Aureimonas psammosilenae]|uniref:type II toxin-antitoxin system VapC family toxin n=1 Tax=Aureimonas psammosilenae TaxID=2495496 RepID=UPI001260D647|nr:type II toxin-antitoxin system VapC family toxin [Aureimonas psammosilenae]